MYSKNVHYIFFVCLNCYFIVSLANCWTPSSDTKLDAFDNTHSHGQEIDFAPDDQDNAKEDTDYSEGQEKDTGTGSSESDSESVRTCVCQPQDDNEGDDDESGMDKRRLRFHKRRLRFHQSSHRRERSGEFGHNRWKRGFEDSSINQAHRILADNYRQKQMQDLRRRLLKAGKRAMPLSTVDFEELQLPLLSLFKR